MTAAPLREWLLEDGPEPWTPTYACPICHTGKPWRFLQEAATNPVPGESVDGEKLPF